MTELKGLPVAAALTENLKEKIRFLAEKDIIPKLAVVRIGFRDDDLAYERGIIKRFDSAGAKVEIAAFREDTTQEELETVVSRLNDDESIHGIMLFRPLPKNLSNGQERIKNLLCKNKDVDCMTDFGMAGVFAGNKFAYPPCTPQAVIELLDYYGIDLAGKKVAVVGRSLVVGKPLAMLLMARNATVTVCHTKTLNLAEECKRADILVACAGAAKMITEKYVNPKQIVIDVGINVVDGKLCGDVDFDEVKDKVEMITPVPGGVGSVTTAVLLKHTVESAMRVCQTKK